MPVFSIITVAYNAEAVIGRTVQSVLGQSYQHIEYIIVDGASTDGTLKMIEAAEQQAQGTAFRYVSEPDRGIYDAMNKGLQMATGDYVWFLNAGDTLKSDDTVAELAEIAEHHKMPDILYGETDLTDGAGNVFAARRLKAPQKLTWKSFRMGMLVSHQAFVVKRGVAGEFDLHYRFSADFDWCIRCLKRAVAIVNTRLRLVNYQYEGTTTANRQASLKERYQIMCKYYGQLPTLIRHIWFALRFYWAKFFKNNS